MSRPRSRSSFLAVVTLRSELSWTRLRRRLQERRLRRQRRRLSLLLELEQLQLVKVRRSEERLRPLQMALQVPAELPPPPGVLPPPTLPEQLQAAAVTEPLPEPPLPMEEPEPLPPMPDPVTELAAELGISTRLP